MSDKLRLFASNRVPEVRDHYVGFFPEVTGTASMQLAVTGQGSFSFSTVKLSGGNGDASQRSLVYRGGHSGARHSMQPAATFERWSGALRPQPPRRFRST